MWWSYSKFRNRWGRQIIMEAIRKGIYKRGRISSFIYSLSYSFHYNLSTSAISELTIWSSHLIWDATIGRHEAMRRCSGQVEYPGTWLLLDWENSTSIEVKCRDTQLVPNSVASPRAFRWSHLIFYIFPFLRTVGSQKWKEMIPIRCDDHIVSSEIAEVDKL
jgi:hypothetical protein